MRVHVLLSGTGDRGGIERYNRAMLRALRGLVTNPTDMQVFSLNDPPGTSEHRGFERRKVEFARVALSTAVREAPSAIIIGHANFSPLVLALRSIAPRTRTFVVAHGLEVEERRRLSSLMGLRAATGIICVSESTRRLVETVQRVPRSRLHLLQYGIPTVSSEAVAVREVDSVVSLLTVSRLDSRETYKGIEPTLRALSLLPDTPVQYSIVGDGDDRSRLQKVVEELGLSNRVTFTGAVDDSSLQALYARSDMFILPSTREGLGIVYLEAMAHGKPVIAVHRCGVADAVVHEANGLLLRDQDPSEIAAAVARLAADSSLRRRLGAFGRNVTVPHFSPERMRAALATILGIPNSSTIDTSFAGQDPDRISPATIPPPAATTHA